MSKNLRQSSRSRSKITDVSDSDSSLSTSQNSRKRKNGEMSDDDSSEPKNHTAGKRRGSDNVDEMKKGTSFTPDEEQDLKNDADESESGSSDNGESMTILTSNVRSDNDDSHEMKYEKTNKEEDSQDCNNEDDQHSSFVEVNTERTKLEDLPRESKERNCRKLNDLKSWVGQTTHHVLFESEEIKYEWNENFVRMPCDPLNKIVVYSKEGNKSFAKRWETIKKALSRDHIIRDVFQLQSAILSYNGHHTQSWDFKCLKHFFLKSKFKEEKYFFFERILPGIIDKACQMEGLFSKSIPFLKASENCMITMNQDQAFCLLANAFLCTFPWRNSDKKHNASKMPSINFSSLFNGRVSNNGLEKIKCIIHYFKRMILRDDSSSESRNISFRRQVIKDVPDWDKSKANFKKLYISPNGTIEDEGAGMLQVDFANKYVGGGVIRHGCVQEEIRFLICPEMILSRLFTEVLDDNEVLIMTGCERFSNYTGYSNTFEWSGNHVDTIESDYWSRKHTEVVAMDAEVIKGANGQYVKFMIDRELNKAYCAFMCPDAYTENTPAVCTGNWGCGAFGGDKELKALIQLIAASEAGRDVCFFTFGDKEFAKSLRNIHCAITKNQLQVGDIVERLREFNNKRQYEHSTLFKKVRDMW